MRFWPVAGADDTALRAANEEVQAAFAYQQPGLLRRTVARSAEGEWLVVTLWRTNAEAEEAAERFGADPATEPLRRLIDPQSVSVSRYDELG